MRFLTEDYQMHCSSSKAAFLPGTWPWNDANSQCVTEVEEARACHQEDVPAFHCTLNVVQIAIPTLQSIGRGCADS